jgi:Raf kinase inhibitor-like YbhB/YbcL family protein
MTLSISSPAFEHEGEIPSRYTCDDADISPALEWHGVPPEAKSLALIVDDPDAPDPKAPKMVYVHWVLFDIPPTAPGLPEGVEARDLPAGTREGVNDWKRAGYGGPCPPVGRHRYYFKLYALDTTLGLQDRSTKADVEHAMRSHVLAEGVLMGTYARDE